MPQRKSPAILDYWALIVKTTAV